jgi:cytochrome c553
VVDKFTIAPRKREARFAFHFSGYISIPTNGIYTFYTESDDGSRLYIGTNLVVRNDGYHAMTSARGNAPLAQGDHLIRVLYFNGDADMGLKVSFEGPGIPKQEIPPAILSHPGQPMVPLGEERWTADPAKAARGRQLFGSLGCAACHQGHGGPPARPGAKPLLELANLAEGCLSDPPQPSAPNYALSPLQRSALQATLKDRARLSQPPSPSEKINHTLAALNCFACHARDGAGGPSPERLAYFTVKGEGDLGDEGRIPPHLTRVGAKLRPEWMREVLVNHGSSRPYMATRMPQFGEANVGHLAAAFEQADDPAAREQPGEYSERDMKFGWKLVGREGLVCISCHTFDKYKSLGIPAMDLSLMSRRLKKDWFRRYLPDPAALRPGTRMPTFWPEGVAVNKDILNGDTDRQINAIWAYLSQGPKADVPAGLIHGKVELVADKEAVIYRNFIKGAGSRAIGVGYPEKANLAFDANDLRLALIWQGPFIDASRHRTDRGVGPEPPLGDHVIQLPPGAPFAVLANQNDPWPGESGKKAGYQMKGYRLDKEQRPTFLYSFGSVRVEDHPMAVRGEFEAHFERELTLQADQPPSNLWFRAGVGSKIEPQKDGSYLVDGKLRIKLQDTTGGQPVVRRGGENAELLLPVTFNGQKATVRETFVW